MKTLLRRPGFGGFLFAQAQVAFNDNATKLILIGIVQWLLLNEEDANAAIEALMNKGGPAFA